jgi:hypothetical protein
MLAKTARVCSHPPDALLSEDVLCLVYHVIIGGYEYSGKLDPDPH